MRILGIDLETTGLDTQKDHITEIAWALWDTEMKAIVHMESHFVTLPDGVVYSPELAKLTGFNADVVKEFGIGLDYALDHLHDLMLSCNVNFFCAHNGLNFDKPFLLSVCERSSFSRSKAMFEKVPWIDTKIDLPLSYTPKSTSLSYMAADHGFLNPFAHRALFDVVTMLKILSQYDEKVVTENAVHPMVRLVAKVSYDNRQMARDAGFSWDGERKEWFMSVRENRAKEIAGTVSFKTELAKE